MNLNPFPCLPRRAASTDLADRRGSRLVGAAIVFCAFALFWAPASATEIVDKVAAVVNGQIITLYDLDRELAPYLAQMGGRTLREQDRQQLAAMRRKLLDRLVDDILLLKEAERLGFQVTDAEVETHIRQFRQSNNMTEEDLARQLRRENLTRDEYKKSIRESMLRHRVLSYMVRRKVLVTDEEIGRHYTEHLNEYAIAKEVELGLILLPRGEDAQSLGQRIRKGEIAFAEAARKYSKGPGASNGGNIGKLKWSELAPEWRAALESVQPGDVTEPFSTGSGQIILKYIALVPGKERSIDEAREEIRQKLYEPKYASQYAEYMKGLRDKAIIDIRL